MKQTLINLTKAFIGESQARNRYTAYAKIAKKEGYQQIGNIFAETADQEREHASTLFQFISDLNKGSGDVTVEASAPTVLGTTADNLRSAINGEHHETSVMYPEFAQKAREEEHQDIAVRLTSIAKAESHHEKRYQKLLTELERGSIFQKEEKTTWVCLECGYEHLGTEPPKQCPSCHHDRGYFQVMCECY